MFTKANFCQEAVAFFFFLDQFVAIVLFLPISFPDSNLEKDRKQLQYPYKFHLFIVILPQLNQFDLFGCYYTKPPSPGQQYRIPDGITPAPCPSTRADDGGDFLSPAGRLVVIGPKPIFEAGDNKKIGVGKVLSSMGQVWIKLGSSNVSNWVKLGQNLGATYSGFLSPKIVL